MFVTHLCPQVVFLSAISSQNVGLRSRIQEISNKKFLKICFLLGRHITHLGWPIFFLIYLIQEIKLLARGEGLKCKF